MPLTQDLYDRLAAHFGDVSVANEGESAVVQRSTATGAALVAPRTVTGEVAGGGRAKVEIIHPGEYYRVSCPKCGDARKRLWVNHRAIEFPWLIRCYNEGCYDSAEARDQLVFMLYKTRRPPAPRVQRGRRDAGELRLVEPPGEVVTLDRLPPSHPACLYLGGERGYDPAFLGRTYGVAYCAHSDRYHQCSNKILVPVTMQGVLVGWQARFIGDRNWKMSPFPKYWDMPGMPKRLMFYNHDLAARCPWVVMVEGVTDVWSVGPMAFSLLGSSLSFGQRRLLGFPPFRDKPLVIMLDADARDENQAITDDLRRNHPGEVVMVDVPAGLDPGALQPAVNQTLIHQAAAAQGVTLSPFDWSFLA